MSLTPFADNILYTVDPLIPQPILDAMLDQCKNLTFKRSLAGEDKGVPSNIRTSSQHWLTWDSWIAGIMHNIFISANNDYFHYDLDHFDSGIQVTRYDKNQKYGWHIDQQLCPDRLPRKLSMTLLLNDNFSGGEFEIHNTLKRKDEIISLKAGSACIFPAWVMHRVKPVKSGTRYSLVAWMNGPQFK